MAVYDQASQLTIEISSLYGNVWMGVHAQLINFASQPPSIGLGRDKRPSAVKDAELYLVPLTKLVTAHRSVYFLDVGLIPRNF